VAPAVREMPMLEGFLPTPTLVLIRFRRWAEIMQLPQPARELPTTTALWHFARGTAYAANGKLAAAENEQKSFAASVETVPADAPFGSLNSARTVLAIANDVLAARIALARRDNETAIAHLRAAGATEATLASDEPPPWFLPSREALGAVLVGAGRAAEAEQVFRAELAQH